MADDPMELVERLEGAANGVVSLKTERGDYGLLEEAASCIRVLVEQNRRASAGVEWQPIETAPKDGTVIDLWMTALRRADCWWGRPHHECGEMGRYCDSCPDRDGWCDVFGYLGSADDDEESFETPTHWQPLPAAPTLGGSDA